MKKKIFIVTTILFALCTCLFVCSACGKKEPPHVHAFDQRVQTEAYATRMATCKQRGEYYFSCLCGEKDTKTFEGDFALNHDFVDSKCKVVMQVKEFHMRY